MATEPLRKNLVRLAQTLPNGTERIAVLVSGYYKVKARWRRTEDGFEATYKGHQLEIWRSPVGKDLVIYIDGTERGKKRGYPGSTGRGQVDFAQAEAEEIVDRMG